MVLLHLEMLLADTNWQYGRGMNVTSGAGLRPPVPPSKDSRSYRPHEPPLGTPFVRKYHRKGGATEGT